MFKAQRGSRRVLRSSLAYLFDCPGDALSQAGETEENTQAWNYVESAGSWHGGVVRKDDEVGFSVRLQGLEAMWSVPRRSNVSSLLRDSGVTWIGLVRSKPPHAIEGGLEHNHGGGNRTMATGDVCLSPTRHHSLTTAGRSTTGAYDGGQRGRVTGHNNYLDGAQGRQGVGGGSTAMSISSITTFPASVGANCVSVMPSSLRPRCADGIRSSRTRSTGRGPEAGRDASPVHRGATPFGWTVRVWCGIGELSGRG